METIKKWIYVKPDLITKFTSEFTGCMLFHLIGSLNPTAECNAIALMTLVFFTAKLSGGHLNPAISCVFNILGYTNPIELFVYISAQITGSIVGALWLSTVIPTLTIGANNTDVLYNGCFVPDESLSLSRIVAAEALGTYSFAIIVFSVVWYTQQKKGYGTIGPIMIGLSLLSPALAFGRLTGAAFNPARTIASYFVYKCVSGRLVGCYIGGQMLGSFLAALTIIPWYGISEDSWYISWIQRELLYIMSVYQQQSIQLNASNLNEHNC
jgi:glycerol uptake facilitator-like aquaporin